MRCAEVREQLPARAEGEVSLAVSRHLADCAECRAEVARYESLAASLGRLSVATVQPPARLKAALLEIPSAADRIEAVREHLSRNRRAYVGGAAVALAGALGAAALRTRRRGVAPATA